MSSPDNHRHLLGNPIQRLHRQRERGREELLAGGSSVRSESGVNALLTPVAVRNVNEVDDLEILRDGSGRAKFKSAEHRRTSGLTDLQERIAKRAVPEDVDPPYVPVLATPLVERTNHVECGWLRPFRHRRYTHLPWATMRAAAFAAHAHYVRWSQLDPKMVRSRDTGQARGRCGRGENVETLSLLSPEANQGASGHLSPMCDSELVLQNPSLEGE